MAKATPTLSPKRAAERLQLHRQAVMILAHRRAKKAVEADLRSKGDDDAAKGNQRPSARVSGATQRAIEGGS
jgi:hypothetical protein